jgi:hypothetical protein
MATQMPPPPSTSQQQQPNMDQYATRLRQFSQRIEPTLPGFYDTLTKMANLSLSSPHQLLANQVSDYIEGIIKNLKKIQPMKIGGKKKKTLRHKRT